MDGDLAPLPALFALAERHDAWLAVDDAHGFGVLGPHGAGSLAHFNLPFHPRLLLMGTLGKAAGVAGAFVAGSETAIEYLLQRARSYIFTTAAPPAVACALSKSLDLIRHGDALRADAGRQHRPPARRAGRTAVAPAAVGHRDPAAGRRRQRCRRRPRQALWQRGLWVPAIRPPTVPKGTARLRISVSAAHTTADIDRLVAALKELA